MRIFLVTAGGVAESDSLPASAPAHGYVWVSCNREEFKAGLADLQTTLQSVCGMQLVDLHVSDLLNQQLPSRLDYTAQYDLLVFRRLASGHGNAPILARRGGPPILRKIDTTPVGFALFDNLLLTVHPTECGVLQA